MIYKKNETLSIEAGNLMTVLIIGSSLIVEPNVLKHFYR